MPKISCVMPARDRDYLIGESIGSIINQTYDDWELIVVDDHSQESDNTVNVVKQFNDKRIKYYKLDDENGIGIPAARNFGNIMTKGEFIAVADSDDINYPYRFKRSLEEFQKTNCDLVYGTLDIWDVSTGEMIKIEGNSTARKPELKSFKKCDYIPNPTVMYKRQLGIDFPYNSFFRRAEDYDFFARLCEFGYKFSFINEPLVKYRVHPERVSAPNSNEKYDYSSFVKKNRGWLT